MRRTHAIAGLALLGLFTVPVPAFAAAASAVTVPTGQGAVRLATLAPQVPADASRLGMLPSNQQLTITVALRPTHTDRLSALLADLYDPASPQYEKWLTPGQFSAEFGPTRAQIDDVTAWLHRQGLDDTSLQGMAIHASGDVQSVSRALSVSFFRYRLGHAASGYIASAAPLVPRAVADDITSIVGLSNTVRLHTSLETANGYSTRGERPTSSAVADAATPVSTGCATVQNFAGDKFWTPEQIGSFYGVNNLFSAGLTGKGKTIALVEFAPSVATDTNSFLSCFGLHNRVSVEPINGGAPNNPDGTLEAEIDIQQAAAQAPGASIVSYEAPNTGVGEYDVYNRIVTDDRAQVVSTSWGDCETDVASSGNFIGAMHTVFEQAAAQGQSVFAASGDSGSEGCFDGTTSATSESLDVDHPADDPFVTGVGGTSLVAAGVEPVWNDCEGELGVSCAQGGGGASGGGLSKEYRRPSWQPVAANATCSTCREVPDISANAGVFETFFDSGWVAVGGTSVAAPTLAGIAADIDQGSKNGRIGDLAPKLGALAELHVYGSALADVDTGINWNTFRVEKPGSNDLTRTHGGSYETAPGFDLASGFGTPLTSGLACPEITSMSPSHGKAGIRVTLHGIGLEKATIDFGSRAATVVSASAKSAVVTVPVGSRTRNVTGTDAICAGNRSASFTY
ncbi:MAG: protease pro-enzyme activation domain-containing protein [Acidimicrobiia bacterium]